MSVSALLHPLSGRLACALTVRCLSNRSADVGKGKKRMRVEENSEVQRVEERCVICGEMDTFIACGDGPARKERA